MSSRIYCELLKKPILFSVVDSGVQAPCIPKRSSILSGSASVCCWVPGSSLYLYPPLMVLLLSFPPLPRGPQSSVWHGCYMSRFESCTQGCVSLLHSLWRTRGRWMSRPCWICWSALCAWSGWTPLPRSYLASTRSVNAACWASSVPGMNSDVPSAGLWLARVWSSFRATSCWSDFWTASSSGRGSPAPWGAVAPTAPAPWGLRVVLWSPAALKMARAHRVDPSRGRKPGAPRWGWVARGGRCSHVFFILWVFSTSTHGWKEPHHWNRQEIMSQEFFLFWNEIGCK